MNVSSKTALSALLVLTLAGCAGTSMKTPKLDSSQYTVIGPSEATATGIMVLGFIPIQQNDRFVRAQAAAIQAKGGDALINTQVQEDWFWGLLVDRYVTTVSGDVVKLKKVQ